MLLFRQLRDEVVQPERGEEPQRLKGKGWANVVVKKWGRPLLKARKKKGVDPEKKGAVKGVGGTPAFLLPKMK